ncbi:hypothetical protein E3P89_04059 [Wallemia ichthyophaga]|nr:hypothetical protein E3P97_02075 [Wallemia ichthyophaga]TIA94735.1 hypothetical protein E3P95_04102 [Wallemia ichthyophaga]TIB19338.1 hypothetical protein E3P89_04059 [Wallemia ichthyophaga]TIB33095.1 hypothetical protein E3P85_01529 [Wallemia ichthyophaga]TIB38206.1 hypothetical protein E3P83_04097 [Wallemia ichthyophaga]
MKYSALTLIQDVVSGDELASDAYPMKEEGPFLTIDCEVITVGGEGADIGGDEGGVDDSKEQKINLVHSFGLKQTQFDKKSYTVHLKDYMKNVVDHLKANNPERVDGFKAEAQAGLKELLSKFGDLEFFMGESLSTDGQVALLNYREDGITPYFTLWKDGLKGQKI